MTINEWIKSNAVLKDGAKMEELEGLVKDLDPLKSVTDKESAIAFIERNGFFKSALDSTVTKAIQTHDEKFNTEKLPEILKSEKEKLLKELNPDKTPEQIRLSELEEKLSLAERREKEFQLKTALMSKAKELNFPGDAEKYYVYGDKAFDILESDKKMIDGLLEKTKKEFYEGNPPPQKPNIDPSKMMKRADFEALPPQAKIEFVNNSGVVAD